MESHFGVLHERISQCTSTHSIVSSNAAKEHVFNIPTLLLGKNKKLSMWQSISTWKREEEIRWIKKMNQKTNKMLVEFKIVESESEDES